MSNKIILASGSPRRREILENQGISFTVIKSDKEEKTKETLPENIVKELSEQKALDVYDQMENPSDVTIIAADTIVALGTEIFGKPCDREDAFRMLQLLQGNTHQVYTGVTVFAVSNGKSKQIQFAEKTDVTMYPMSEEEINAYIATKEPEDKAGAYAIQGKCAIYIERINGDYQNVVGLPVARLYQECRRAGVSLYD